MKRLALLWAAVILGLVAVSRAEAFNLVTDVRDNLTWTFGQAAQAGEGYNFSAKQWDASALAEIAEYRFLAFSYGGTQIDPNSSKATDTFKVGLLSNFFFDLFKNPTTPQMAWMKNVNIGPSYAIPVFSGATGHKGTFLVDINYKFGGTTTP